MPRPKFDMTDGDFIFGDDHLGFDSDGHMMMDTETGEIHFTTGGDFDQFDEDDD